MADEGERECELINATVKDDNGTARLQTSPIKGLKPGQEHMVTVDLAADGLKVSTRKQMDYKVKLSRDITGFCEITKKEIDKDGRLIVHLKKTESFRLAALLAAKN